MISNLSYDCVPAARQEKPSFIFEGNLNLPKAEPDTLHEPRGREVREKYINTNCK